MVVRNNTQIQELLDSREVRTAFTFFELRAQEITEQQIEICSIPAPPFGERERAEFLRGRFISIGLTGARIDEVGNCVALRAGRSASPLLAVSAHLDTVFPPGTDVTVRRHGVRLLAPGIADDGCGLVALTALAQALESGKIETEGSILFVTTVGEEGAGNLRGVRHLLTAGEWANQIDAFVSFDGSGVERITNAALGSRRYRVVIRGAGGHSWGDFGVPNPAHALGRAISRLASYPAPADPRTTFNVGHIEGGTSINAIPSEAAMDVDLRSVSESALLRLDAFFRRAVREAAEDENAARREATGPLELKVNLIGERPSGETSAASALVTLAQEVTRALGITSCLDRASTDSNVPIAMGIPAITLGAGGSSGNTHTLDEWFDPRQRELGLKRALLLVLRVVGINGSGE
ncbi:MAG: M20/M25/M40 family metallo-hydrolase [bacterium]